MFFIEIIKSISKKGLPNQLKTSCKEGLIYRGLQARFGRRKPRSRACFKMGTEMSTNLYQLDETNTFFQLILPTFMSPTKQSWKAPCYHGNHCINPLACVCGLIT